MTLGWVAHPWLALICGVIFLLAGVVFFIGLQVVTRPHERKGFGRDDWQFWHYSIVVMVIAAAGFVLSMFG